MLKTYSFFKNGAKKNKWVLDVAEVGA